MKTYPYQTPEGIIHLVEKRELDQLIERLAEAHDDLLNIAMMPEYDQDDCHRLRNLGMKAASKLQPYTKP
jgi:hypothetical protein